MKKPWTDSEINSLIKLCKDGKSTREISTLLNRHTGSIVTKTRRLNIEIKCVNKKYIKLSQQNIQEIILDYKNGINVPQISIKYNVSKRHIRNILRINNIYIWMKDKGKLNEETIMQLIESFYNGEKRDDIQKKFKISQKYLEKIIKERNLKRQRCRNLLNKKIGKLTIKTLSEDHEICRQRTWLCVCDCGNQKIVPDTYLRSQRLTQSCGCSSIFTGSKSYHWKGHGEISLSFFNSIILTAKQRNIDFNVTIEQIWDLFVKQNRKCALSGIEIKFSPHTDSNNRTASLDRIDSSKIYTIDNIQWVHKEINRMKMAMSEANFIEFCHIISSYQKNKSYIPNDS